jgi:hypothetical protein
MTDENSGDQEVRQQCDTGQAVELALDYVDVTTQDAGFQVERWSSDNDETHLRVLAAEVRRLREENGEIRAYNSRLAASCAESIKERDALREESQGHLHRAARVALQLVDTQDELGRLREELAAVGAGYVAKLDKLTEGYISDRRVLRAVMGDHLAKLRRVEALPAKWRASADRWNARGCAGDLDAALKGEPSVCAVCGAKHSEACPFV